MKHMPPDPYTQEGGPHAMPLPRRWRALLLTLAVLGCLSVGFSVSNTFAASAQANNDRRSSATSEAQAHYSTCLTTLNANWRRAYSVVGVAATTATGEDIDPKTAKRLNLPASRAETIRQGNARLVAALSDDGRINDKKNPICPFVAGRPDKTPARPVKSETSRLEATLHR